MLLNNYYIIRKAMGIGTGYYGQIGIHCNDNYFKNFSVDEILKLKLGSGNTLSQVVLNSNDVFLDTEYSNDYKYSIFRDPNPRTSTGCTAGTIVIGLISSTSYIADSYLVSPTSTTWAHRNLAGYESQQTFTDFAPGTLFYIGGSWYGRFKDFIRVAAGSSDDLTPVTISDYNLTNMYDLDDIKISAVAPCNGLMVITLYNNTNSEKTIREIGIYDCQLKCKITYDDYDNQSSVDIPNLTAEQKQAIETSLARITDWQVKYNNFDEAGQNSLAGNFDIPILISKTKLTTPIVLQPSETKTITYEIKWS